jgi:predicted ribosome-associated RNA-binding protein Tma20
MNNIYGALVLTVPLLLVIGYIVFFRNKTVYEPMMTQSMIHNQYSKQRKYIEKINKKSQSKIRQEKENVKVIIVENTAYWIKDNAFYTAPMVDNLINKDYAIQVDTSSMDKVQLDKMLFILDKLREGISNDSRGAGNA